MAKRTKQKHELSLEESEQLLSTLRGRFEKNMSRHRGIEWAKIEARLEEDAEKMWSLNEMEKTGGEPDVVGYDKKSGEFIFYDCSAESPKGRRSVCYDSAALESRKEHKPEDNAVDMAAAMGIELLTEEQYRGALFCDRRYDHVFVYHNGAESYYAARGFRGVLRV
jgi:hypothetical protein